jgi:hypothetical protein
LFILASSSSGAAQKTAVEGSEIWGVSVSGGTNDDISSAVEAGADFLLIEGESAPGAALLDDDTGKGFAVPPELSEDRAKAVDAGPYDFLVLDSSNISFPLNVGSVLDIQEQLARYSRHIFLQMTEIPDQSNLELLRDIGISALIYDGKTTTGDDLGKLRKAIDQLEPKKQKSAAGAVLPQSGDSSPRESDHDDQDHDDEDWD